MSIEELNRKLDQDNRRAFAQLAYDEYPTTEEEATS